MSKISVKRRQFQIRKKQKRQAKMKKLRQSLGEAKTEKAKKEVLEKMNKIAPHITEKEIGK